MLAWCSKYGFLHCFDLYLGTNVTDVITLPNDGLGGNVVLKLIEKLSVPRHQGHKVYCDKYFTIIQLMEMAGNKFVHQVLVEKTEPENVKCNLNLNQKRLNEDTLTSEQLTISLLSNRRTIMM